jgi:hypothetical protein
MYIMQLRNSLIMLQLNISFIIIRSMNRKTLGLFAIPVIAAIMIVAGASTQLAIADPDGSNPQSAGIARDFGCGLFDGEGNLVITNTSHSVVTSDGSSNLKCSAQVAPPSSGHAEVLEGFGCGTLGGFTTDSHNVVSKSGKAKLSCHLEGTD